MAALARVTFRDSCRSWHTRAEPPYLYRPGTTLYAAWRAMLRADRFVTLDSARLATAAITSEEYVARYAHP